MINKKILAGLLLCVTAAGIGSTYAANTSSGSIKEGKAYSGFFNKFGGGKHHRGAGFKNNLTDSEKTSLESMTD